MYIYEKEKFKKVMSLLQRPHRTVKSVIEMFLFAKIGVYANVGQDP